MRKTQRPDFTRAVQWLSKHMTTLTQACLVLCLALISVAYIRIFNPTASESAFSPASRPLPIYNVDTQEKKIAISFDAAWGEEKTDEILQILKDRDIETTFFLVGYWVDKYPDRVRQIGRGRARDRQPLQHPPAHERAERGADRPGAERPVGQGGGPHRARGPRSSARPTATTTTRWS